MVDHCALCVLNKKKPNSPKLARWVLAFSEFDFEIVYTKGSLHEDVDCLSRAPVDNPIDDYLDNMYLITPLSVEGWIECYTEGEDIEIMEKAANNVDQIRLINRLIYVNNELYVPVLKRDIIMRESHDSSIACQGGVQATLDRLSVYLWSRMKEDVKTFVASCNECQKRKAKRTIDDEFHRSS